MGRLRSDLLILGHTFFFSLLIFQLDLFDWSQHRVAIIYSLVQFALATFIYWFSAPPFPARRNLKLFLFGTICFGWAFLLRLDTFDAALPILRLLVSFMPSLYFVLLGHLNYLDHTRCYKIGNWVLASGIPITFFFVFSHTSAYIFYSQLTLLIVFYTILVLTNRASPRIFTHRHQKLLLLASILGLTPYLLASTIIAPLFQSNAITVAITFFMIVPIAVTYYIIREINWDFSLAQQFFLKKFGFYTACLLGFIGVNQVLFRLNAVQVYWIVLAALLFLYCQNRFLTYLNRMQIKKSGVLKESLAREKLELLADATYDDYLRSAGNFLDALIKQALPVKGTAIIRQEGGHNYCFSTNGTLSHLTKHNFKEYSHFPLTYNSSDYGYLVIDTDAPLTGAQIATLKDLCQILGGFFHGSRLLMDSKDNYLKLPRMQYDDYLNLRLIQDMETLKKEFSFYLHDEVSQTLIALKNLTECIPDQPELLQLVLDTYEELILSVRDAMYDLYPASLGEAGLYQSLKNLVEKLQSQTLPGQNVSIRLHGQPKIYIRKELRYPLFRAIKELTQNALKHADASTITISLAEAKGDLLIEVADDGCGFDLADLEASLYHNHLGLLSVKQAINALHGRLRINSRKNSGTRIQINIPQLKE